MKKRLFVRWRKFKIRKADNDDIFSFLKRDFEEKKNSLTLAYQKGKTEESRDGRSAKQASFIEGKSLGDLSLRSDKSGGTKHGQISLEKIKTGTFDKSTQVNARESVKSIQAQILPLFKQMETDGFNDAFNKRQIEFEETIRQYGQNRELMSHSVKSLCFDIVLEILDEGNQ